MTKKDLKKQFMEQWKEKNQTKCMIMQIFSIVEWIPWLIALYLVYCTNMEENLLACVVKLNTTIKRNSIFC